MNYYYLIVHLMLNNFSFFVVLFTLLLKPSWLIHVAVLLLFRRVLLYFTSFHYYSYCKTPLNKKIVAAIKPVNYHPSFFFMNEMLNTFLCIAVRTHWRFDKRTTVVNDGGATIMTLSMKDTPTDPKRIVLIIPGVAADEKSNYIYCCAGPLSQLGFTCIAYFNRIISTNFSYNGKFINLEEDISDAIDFILDKYPGAKLYGVGLSYGGAQLINYLGKVNRHKPLEKKILAGMTFGTPFDFKAASRFFQDTLYEFAIHLDIKGYFLRNRHLFADGDEEGTIKLDYKGLESSRNIRELDDAFVCKLFGKRVADEYYSHLSPYQRVLDIDVPCVFVQTKNDFTSDPKMNPYSEVKMNPNLVLVESSYGGHLSYLESFTFGGVKQGMGKICAEYFKLFID